MKELGLGDIDMNALESEDEDMESSSNEENKLEFPYSEQPRGGECSTLSEFKQKGIVGLIPYP